MPARFEDAPAVRKLAEELIEAHHPHLVNPEGMEYDAEDPETLPKPPVVLVYLFRDDVPTSNGKEVWGTAKKITGREWFWARRHLERLGRFVPQPDPGQGFRIEISEPVWARLDEWERRALVDHELMHCKAARGFNDSGDPALKLYTVAHDLEVFNAEAERYPGWRRNLQTFEELVRRTDPQLSLVLNPNQNVREEIIETAVEAVADLYGAETAEKARAILTRAPEGAISGAHVH